MVMTPEQIRQVMPFLIGGCMFLMLILFWLKSFIFAWLQVRASGGSKVLVRVRNDLHNYYRAGSLDTTFLYFKARKRPDLKKPHKMLPIVPKDSDKPTLKECMYRDWGVNVVEVDDVKECFLRYKDGKYETLAMGNSEAYDLAIQKAQMQPPKGSQGIVDPRVFQIIMIIGIAACVIGCVYEISTLGRILKGMIDIHGHVEHIDMLITNMTLPR